MSAQWSRFVAWLKGEPRVPILRMGDRVDICMGGREVRSLYLSQVTVDHYRGAHAELSPLSDLMEMRRPQ